MSPQKKENKSFMPEMLEGLLQTIKDIPAVNAIGSVTDVRGQVVYAQNLNAHACVGCRCLITTKNGMEILSEVIGFREGKALLMGFQSLDGVGPGDPVRVHAQNFHIFPTDAWLGRVVDGSCTPIDGGDPLPEGGGGYPVFAPPLPAHLRAPVGPRINLGVRAINTFTTCCQGQRMGIFSGSGVGKSVLLSQIARFTSCDVAIIGLIGERGREVQEFITQYLGPEGLAKSIVVVATSDEPAVLRRQAAALTLTLAEAFRDKNKHVLCMMDSVTRFAMAMREIGLSVGEPPASKGYTPSVFSALPRLLERAGPGRLKPGTQDESIGSITGIFTVLVEGDDHNEPVADTVRGILDGHLVLERKIAERNRFPAINVLRSISRTMPDCNGEDENTLIRRARELMSLYDDMEEMIRLGAYNHGSDPKVDEAIYYHAHLEAFLAQEKHAGIPLEQGFAELSAIFAPPPAPEPTPISAEKETHG